jgi:hypothetical protein
MIGKRESALPMSCNIVLKVATRSMLTPSQFATVTHDGAAYGGMVYRFHGLQSNKGISH